MKTAQEDFASATLNNGGKDLLGTLREVLPAINNLTRTGPLAYRNRTPTAEADDSDTKPAIRVLYATVASDSRIDFEFRYGRVGAHDLAIGLSEDDDAVLTGKASTNIFRASIYLPASGNAAILVVENRSNLAPFEYFLKHLSFHMKEQDAAKPEAEQHGWWRLMGKGVTDVDRLNEVLSQGSGAALQLEKHVVQNGRRRTSGVVVRQDGLPAGKLQQVRAMVFAWLGLTDSDEGAGAAPEGTPVQQVASLLDVDVVDEQFNDGAVVYDDGTGRTHIIRPSSVREVFVYPLAEGQRPTAVAIRSAAEDRLRRITPTLGVQLTL
ncbi:hypothetical protein [Rathayibacter sp. VKM Ac-2801]|uniref:hypothetical protein n=1 Tax=Rathayibacter sp. VKM Ac-2801 TaxID=2609255 RepID=UPI00131F9378|nr:hypothetical protein [Rathayibacter sp. VKM Ac-2801]QHC71033.1 hypothetical protein GSU45_12065 [Rathayibacter sp. VKM Ac-2801]